MNKTTRLMTFFILVCLLTVACGRTEMTKSVDVVDEVREDVSYSLPTSITHTGRTESGDILYEMGGMTLPLPPDTIASGQESSDTSQSKYTLETDVPAEEIITYLNLNWPLSGTAGFVETNPSGGTYGHHSFGITYDGVFKRGETTLYLFVNDETTIEVNKTVRKTVILISVGENGPQVPTNELERIPLPIIDHDVETTWEGVPLLEEHVEGRVNEEKAWHDNSYEVIIDQPTMAVIQQINETWVAAGLSGNINTNNSQHGYGMLPDGLMDEYQVYSGHFEHDEITYYVEAQQWAKVPDTAEFTVVHITPVWTAAIVDFDALPLPDANVMEEKPIWSHHPMNNPGDLGTSFILDVPSDRVITFINEKWADEGLDGGIDSESDGRWVSYDPHAEQTYYQGRFDDIENDVAYIVRVYDIAGERKTAISIVALVMAHADHHGY